MTETKREIERKYEPPAGADLPDLTRAPGVASAVDRGVVELDAVYYDTPDHRLAADRITLRRRTGGSDEGWHLKLPVSLEGGVRDEIHAPLAEERPGASDPDAAAPPVALAGLVRSRVRDAPLVPVIRLRTARHLHDLVDAEGAPLAEVSVDRVEARRVGRGGAEGGGKGAVRWTEAEVELADGGAPALLDRVEERLREAGWRPSRAVSKLARALAETSGKDTAPSGPPPSGRDGRDPGRTAADHVLAYLRTQRDALVELDPAVRRDLPDAVHRMRVATRRARSALRTHRKVLDRAATEPIVDELKWLAAELGVDRDREVLAERLTAALDDLPAELCDGPVRERLGAWSEGRHRDVRPRLLAVLDGDRHLALLAALDALLADPPLRDAAGGRPKPLLRKAVRKERRRLRRRLDEALRQPPGDGRDVALHQARKAAKRLRYAAESAAPALGSDARRTISAAKRVQRLLGDHQDSVMARGTLRDIAAQAHAAGESTFTHGLLYAREQHRAAQDESRLAEGADGL